MKNKHGFTIIELLVVIVIIGIVGSMSVFGYLNIQKQARDDQRMSSAVVVAERLEKYYTQNGEYPSVAKVTSSNADSVKQLLEIPTIESLIAPNAPSGSLANAWRAGAASTTNQLAYSGNTDATSGCLSGTTATDVCEDFRIQFYKEKTNTVETIYSRHKSIAATTPPPPVAPTISAPSAPTVTIALSGSNAVGTRSDTSCRVGALLQYAFRSRTNDGTWSSYTAWGTATSSSLAAAQGSKYGFQAKAKCVEGDYSSAEAVSAEATYIRPISSPTAPALTNSTSGNITTWSWPAVSCPAGTTVYYGINRGTDFDTSGTISWMGWVADQTATTWTRDTSSQGYQYTAVMKAKCTSAYDTSPWSAESNYSQYLRPVAAPGGVYNWGYGVFNSRTIYRWTWTEPACGPGTAKSFQWDGYIGDVNNTNGWNMYWTDKGPYYHYWYGASAPSRQDYGWYTGPILDLDFNGASTPYGIDVYARIKYRCQNPATLRTAEGGWTQSPGYST